MKDVTDILDLTVEQIDELMHIALDMIDHPEKYSEACKGKILATLFYEPSTRTRLSFESAMLSMGGSVIGFSGAQNASVSKGESVHDTSIVVSQLADIIAMRTLKEGAPLVAANSCDIPVINAGDGGHNHPTQTLLDLLTIYHEKGTLENLTVGFCGDLKYGRTVHSLLNALARYAGLKVILISPEVLALPQWVKALSHTILTLLPDMSTDLIPYPTLIGILRSWSVCPKSVPIFWTLPLIITVSIFGTFNAATTLSTHSRSWSVVAL